MFLSLTKRLGFCLAACAIVSLTGCCGGLGGRWRSEGRNPIPERYPLGSVNRAHYHAMQTNAEATDFVFNRNDFVGETADFSPDAKDHLLEVAARMRSAPFPVIVERSENNTNPELDALRRANVARHLAELGNPDADQRTFVATPYERGLNAYEGEADYFQYFGNRNTILNNFNNANNFSGFGGGFGFGP